MITTTLKDLRKHGACFEGYNRVVRSLQGKEFREEDEQRDSYIRFAHKEEIDLPSILKSNGIDDALWSLRASTASERDMRLFAVWCARQVEHLSADSRVKACNDVSERFANGEATQEELAAARDAAWAARDAARDAAWAARDAARDAARAAWDAARDAAWAARDAARAAWDAARDAVWDAARDAVWDARDAVLDAQKEMFIKMCNGDAPWQKEEK